MLIWFLAGVEGHWLLVGLIHHWLVAGPVHHWQLAGDQGELPALRRSPTVAAPRLAGVSSW